MPRPPPTPITPITPATATTTTATAAAATAVVARKLSCHVLFIHVHNFSIVGVTDVVRLRPLARVQGWDRSAPHPFLLRLDEHPRPSCCRGSERAVAVTVGLLVRLDDLSETLLGSGERQSQPQVRMRGRWVGRSEHSLVFVAPLCMSVMS